MAAGGALPAMLDDSTITTVCKVIGGLPADGLQLNFGQNCNDSFSINIWREDSPSLTFRKMITNGQSSHRTIVKHRVYKNIYDYAE